MKRLERDRQHIIETAQKKLQLIEDNLIFEKFNERGYTTDSETKEWQKDRRRESSDLCFSASPSLQAGLGNPEYLADFEYWSRSTFYSIDEAVYLSLGFEPHPDLISEMEKVPEKGRFPEPEATFLKRRAELFVRQFDPEGLEKSIDPLKLHAWVSRVSLEVHPGFKEMLVHIAELEASVHRVVGISSVSPKVDEKPIEERERATLSKLLIAMAITEYGYDPAQERSPIPREIEAITDKLGLNVSAETIRKHLQRATKYLPDDWKP